MIITLGYLKELTQKREKSHCQIPGPRPFFAGYVQSKSETKN
jgi:hypothetical protein